ncbi:hypothetical protein AAFF_G00260850 [Aldrovandia affinis]|uniref:Glutamate [NMDA] receptor epsilon subunit C-terminal domain-containing protein n=1 Tax=Aldrovandia affinis TaxID=143900 RepID=A0AAD7RBS1_9TELE|nr:hypothetical protein AAFF_G00260850 [Aldrovandia affinis]
MRCDACKKTGNLYDISEDNNPLLDKLGGKYALEGGKGGLIGDLGGVGVIGGVQSQTQAQRRKPGFGGRQLRRQHSYDTFVDLQKEEAGGMGGVMGGFGGGLGGGGMGGMLPPPRSVSLKDRDRFMEGVSPYAHIFERHAASERERDRDRDPLFFGGDRAKGGGSSFGLFRGSESGLHRRSVGERDKRDRDRGMGGVSGGGGGGGVGTYSLSKSLYPDKVNQNPFVPTFGDDQCLLHGAKSYYVKKQQQPPLLKSSRSDFRNSMGVTSFLPASATAGVMANVASRFPKELSLGGMAGPMANHHGGPNNNNKPLSARDGSGVGQTQRPFNGSSNGHVYEKLSSIESDV